MSAPSNEEVMHRYLDAHARHDLDELGKLRAPDWYEERPQSREPLEPHHGR